MPISMLHPTDQKIINDRISGVVAMRRTEALRAVENAVARHFERVGSGNHTEFSDLDAGIDRAFEAYER